jgi:hypothetical protein
MRGVTLIKESAGPDSSYGFGILRFMISGAYKVFGRGPEILAFTIVWHRGVIPFGMTADLKGVLPRGGVFPPDCWSQACADRRGP